MTVVVGIAMVKDEEDIVGATVAHMLTQVDHVMVADNLSSDRTREILEGLGVWVLDDPDPGYRQSAKMTHLARVAHDSYGAEWIVPFDADEIWVSAPHHEGGRLADVLDGVGSQWLAAAATLYDHVAAGTDDLGEADPVQRIGWRRAQPGALPKVACRWRDDLVIEQGNHGASYDGGATVLPGQLVVHHYPYRSAEQFTRKARNGAAAYAATDLPYEMGQHWRQYGALIDAGGDEVGAEIFHQWFYVEDPLSGDYVQDFPRRDPGGVARDLPAE